MTLRGKFTLSYDGSCLKCSQIARYLDDLEVPRVQVLQRSELEPLLAAPIADDVPFAIDWTAGTPVAVTGVRMRLRLARLLGPRRGTEAMTLLLKELAARAHR